MNEDEVWNTMIGEREHSQIDEILRRDLQMHLAAGRAFTPERIEWYRYGLICGLQVSLRLFGGDIDEMLGSIRGLVSREFPSASEGNGDGAARRAYPESKR